MASITGAASGFPLGLLFLVTGAVLALHLLYKWLLPKPFPGIPYNEAATKNLLGDVPELLSLLKTKGRTRPWFGQQFTRHQSPIVQYFLVPFSKPIIGVADFRESQDILLRRTKEFDHAGRILDVFRPISPEHHISMTSTDPRFKGNKDLVRDLMAPKFLNQISAPQVYEKTLLLIQLWSLKTEAAGEAKAFEARADIIDATTDMISAAAFAYDNTKSALRHQLDHLKGLPQPVQTVPLADGSAGFPRPKEILLDAATIKEINNHSGALMKSGTPGLLHKWRMLTQSSLRKALKMKKAIVDQEIENSLARLSNNGETLSALDEILRRERKAAEKEGRTPDFHSPKIIDEVYGYLIGGQESTSASLSWTVKLLADNQEVQDKLRSHLQAAFKDALEASRQPTAAEITAANIPYLDAVIEEGLRVRPPVPLNARQAIVDTTILGHPIPKGTSIFLLADGPDYLLPPFPVPDSVRTESSREKGWGGRWDPEDMHLYKPERWLKEKNNGDGASGGGGGGLEFDPQAGPFISFSLGKRGCFGRRLALLQSRLFMVLLVWNFELCKLDENFSSYEAREDVFTYPLYCYVGLKKAAQ
ncbi:cytochrome P450 [Xylariales sp. PMI_506]|nr:cytochrome P450 [Xylariales sp. PMI_506]